MRRARRFTQAGAGYCQTCSVRTNGTLDCWTFGRENYLYLSPPDGTFTQTSGGWWHTCSLRTDGTFARIGVDERLSCGVRTNGTIACWGIGPPLQAPPPVD